MLRARSSHVPVDEGIDAAIVAAMAPGAALVAAHPFDSDMSQRRERLTLRFALDPELRRLVHRHELFNRSQLFAWVAGAGLPVVAGGDVHRAAHLGGWKTLLPCARDEQAVVDYLRTSRPVYLTTLERVPGAPRGVSPRAAASRRASGRRPRGTRWPARSAGSRRTR